jgi:SAM-dependent methyltransferase
MTINSAAAAGGRTRKFSRTAIRRLWWKLPSRLRYALALPPYVLSVAPRLLGDKPYECPVCRTHARFLAFGQPPVYNARCVNCGSQSRHRLIALAIEQMSLASPEDRLLHFAPEPPLAPLLRRHVGTYVAADLDPNTADLVLNIENIDQPDGSVDIVVVNHVLEHVDDAKALSEIFRVLRPGGRLIATVPLIEGWDATYENPEVVEPAARAAHFGQWDHVRFYGRDFRDRMRAAGFELSEFVADGEAVVRYSLLRGERVFIGRKPGS